MDEPVLVLCELLSVVRVNSDVAQSGCAVILNVYIGGREELNKYGYGACVYKLLSILIYNS